MVLEEVRLGGPREPLSEPVQPLWVDAADDACSGHGMPDVKAKGKHLSRRNCSACRVECARPFRSCKSLTRWSRWLLLEVFAGKAGLSAQAVEGGA